LVEGSALALRAHVGAGADPSIDTAVATVGASGATRLQPLKIAG
jgi:hypothetical protein